MKILHVAETMRGGIASYINDYLATCIEHDKKYDLVVLCPETHVNDLDVHRFSAAKNIELITFKSSDNRILSSLFMTLSVLKLLYRLRPDVVHLHSTFAGFFLRLPLRLLFPFLNIVYCPHGWAFDRVKNGLSNKVVLLVERFLSLFSNYIICISRYEYKIALSSGFSERKLVLIQNGIQESLPNNSNRQNIDWPDNKIRVLFVGRFDAQKGIDIFFRAMSISPGSFSYVIGDSVLNDVYHNYDVPNNCHLLGWLPRESIYEYYSSADVLVMPSRWEGFGLTAIEAMRSNLAVIATNVGGLSEIVVNKVTGYLVDPEDHIAIAALLEDNDKYTFDKLGKSGFSVFKNNFSMTRVLNELDNVYRKNI